MNVRGNEQLKRRMPNGRQQVWGKCIFWRQGAPCGTQRCSLVSSFNHTIYLAGEGKKTKAQSKRADADAARQEAAAKKAEARKMAEEEEAQLHGSKAGPSKVRFSRLPGQSGHPCLLSAHQPGGCR